MGIIYSVLRFIAAGVLIAALSCCSGGAGPVRTGEPAPGGILPDVAGTKMSVPDDFKGMEAVLLFWEKNCPYCAKEMPALESIYQRFHEQGFVIAAINVGDTKEEVQKVVEEKGLTFPVLLDSDRQFAKRYGVKALPMMFFISDTGKISRKILGGMGSAELEKMIVESLKQ